METMEPSLVYKQNCTAHSQPVVNIGIHFGHVVMANCAKFFVQWMACHNYFALHETRWNAFDKRHFK